MIWRKIKERHFEDNDESKKRNIEKLKKTYKQEIMKYQWWRVREKRGKTNLNRLKKKRRLMEDERKDVKQKKK